VSGSHASTGGSRPVDGRLDEALERLASTDAEYGVGLSNHAPMVAEALDALGRPATILPWLDGYAPRLEPARAPVEAIPEAPAGAWRGALGDLRRAGDWTRFFARRLAEAPWRAVLAAWVPRLASGLFGAATHGVIRTGHAARSLGRAETPPRRGELVRALGYWAASWQELPGAPAAGADPSGERGLRPAAAFARVPIVPASRRSQAFLISDAARVLADLPRFRAVVDLVDPGTDPGAAYDFAAELAAASARALLRHGAEAPIAYVHAVTAPAALDLLEPDVPATDRAAARRFAWQAAAAIHACYAAPERPEPRTERELAPDELVDRAIESGDEHAIKLVEACLRLAPRAGDPAVLPAAARGYLDAR